MKSLKMLFLCAFALFAFTGGTDRPAYAVSSEQANIGGVWSGDFGAGDWTFKFERTDGAWVGKYSYPDYDGWNRLKNFSATNTSVKFELQSDISTKFDLKLDGAQVLSGNVLLGANNKTGRKELSIPLKLTRIKSS